MRPLSIRSRIRLWFVATTALLLAGFSVALYLRTEADGLARFDHHLFERALAVAAACEWEDGRLNCDPGSLLAEADGTAPLRGFVVTSVPKGDLVYRSPALTDHADWMPSSERVAGLAVGVPLAGEITTVDGSVLRCCTLRNRLRDHDDASEESPHLAVVTFGSLAPAQKDIRAFGWRLLLIGGLALACAALVAGFLAKRIVDPLARIAAETSQVEARSEGLVSAPKTGDEIEQLVLCLNRTFQRMREAYRRQTRFAADASHELRTPLAVILAASEVALRRPRGPSEYQEALTQIADAARRSEETLSGLLLLARADAGRLESQREPLQLADLVADLVAKRKHITWSTQGPTRIRGDVRLLRILVENLLGNAVRYSPPDATVEVRVIGTGSSVGPSNSVGPGNKVRFEVEDHGIGIAADKLAQVFEPFYRTDEARSRAAGGSGLGLAMVRAIAEVQEANCSIRSTVGVGTCVIVEFPADLAEDAAGRAVLPGAMLPGPVAQGGVLP